MVNSYEPKQQVDDAIHDSRKSWSDKLLFKAAARTWDVGRCGRPVIHESVLKRKDGPVEAGGDPASKWPIVEYRRIAVEGTSDTEGSQASPISIGRLIERIKSGLADKTEYEIEPWDNQHNAYGMPIEILYRHEFDSQKG